MPSYLVTDPQTGRKLKLTGDSPPTEQELEQIFSNAKPAQAKPIQDLYNLARSGDAQALAEYNQRAQSAGQNTLEQDQAANNPTTGNDNFVSGVGKSFMDTAFT